jgi:uncharacterized membrane protein YbhN (UPF0104 family)
MNPSPDNESTVEFDRTSPVAPEAPDTLPGEATSRARLKWVLRLLAGLVLLAVLVSRSDSAAFGRALGRVPVWVLAAGAFWYLAGQVLSAWKWRLLLGAGDADVPLSRCCTLYWLGMFSNLWLPGSIGGDAVRIWRLRSAGVAGGLAAASVLVERLTGFAALLILGACGLLFTHAGARVSTLLLVSLTAILAVPIAFALLRKAARAPLQNGKFGRKLLAVADSVALYAAPHGRGALFASLLISFAFQASQIGLGIGLARAVGLLLPATTFVWLVPLLALASLVPVGIGGLGVREAAAVALLGSAAPAELVIAWSLLWQAIVWLSSLPGVFWLGQHGTLIQTDAKIDRTVTG